MAEIVLTTLNARYIHAAFGLRYLMANLGSLRERATLVEFDITQRPADVVEALLALEPKIIGIGVYIWNVIPAFEVAAMLKRLRPDILIVLGGPEVSYETESQPIVACADFVIQGEADHAFACLCAHLLAGQRPGAKIVAAELPAFDTLVLPYELYTDRDAAERVIYVEASRGCPFACEFCLSSLDIPVRAVPLPALLHHLDRLLQRGVRQFKFVDRTFNLQLATGQAILQFFRERCVPGLFLHFEMIPDRLPDGLRRLIEQFPAGALQFEVGIQTFNEEVAQRIRRRQDNRRAEDNLRYLRRETGVHVHADLILGLPGESIESFAAGFDRLVGLEPQEIQVGLLKRLRGTPIGRHDPEWSMLYNPSAPYEILQNRLIDFATMQRLRRFSRYWDLVANSGNFVETTPRLWAGGGSPFERFLAFSDWLFGRCQQTHGVALVRLADALFEFLTAHDPGRAPLIAASIARDFARVGRTELPAAVRRHTEPLAVARPDRATTLPKRQARHANSHTKGPAPSAAPAPHPP